jgi:hypothetical protein
MTFAGGWADAQATGSKRCVVSLIELPQAGKTSGFTFSVADGAFKVAHLLSMDNLPKEDGDLSEISVSLAKRPFPWEQWRGDKARVVATEFRYNWSGNDFATDYKIEADLKNGKIEVGNGNWSRKVMSARSFPGLYYFSAPMDQIKDIRMSTRRSASAEIQHLHLQPDTQP